MVYVIWTDPAIEDLRAIKEYIKPHSPAVAQRFCMDLYRTSERRRQFPKSGQVIPEFGSESIREILFHDYRIIDQVAEGACYVMAVIHGSRDLCRHLDPEYWDHR